ncbi:cell division protein ZapA [Acinetobacter nectaris]|uniref:cell division protein ZapA n=1 Tax=Acinetobacter nectaris TaxID=1219382 RepID=UPI001F2B2602|nr:cell division protein ZapA [Acinetobacter nectaris]MCF8998832.1 cell division protein ZapA [Acinetobacter nectaris]MCF9027927.1 cell division protein ZapA [Acinetobacter nectaris]
MSSNTPIVVELRIIEQIFRLSTTDEERGELEKAADILNQRFQEFRAKAPRIEHNKLVVMVALELMQEVLSLNKSLQQYEQCEHLLKTVLESIEKETV